MKRISWIRTSLSVLTSLFLVNCSGKSSPSLYCSGSSCNATLGPSCTATPSVSSVTSGTDLSINISASGGTAPYTVFNPSTSSQISFFSNTNITQNFNFSVSASTLVTRTATVIDSQGAVGSCSWSVTEIPNSSNTALACSIQVSSPNPRLNDPVQVTVQATGGASSTYSYGPLNYDAGKQASLSSNSDSLAYTAVTYATSGQKLLSTTVTNGTQTASCSNNLTVQTPSLSLTAANGLATAMAGNTITVVANLSGVATNSGVLYQFTSSNPNVLISYNNVSNSAVVSTVGNNAQNAVITAYASIDRNIIGTSTLPVAFTQNTPPTPPSIDTTPIIPAPPPPSILSSCTIVTAPVAEVGRATSLTITPIGGSGTYMVDFYSDIPNTISPPAPGSYSAQITFSSAGTANLLVRVTDQLSGLKVSCSSFIRINNRSDLNPGEFLYANQVLVPASTNTCSCRAVMQEDGNFVVYRGTTALWNTKTYGRPGAFFTFQTDRNLVVYDTNYAPLWNSKTTNGNATGSRLVMQGDCNLVLYAPNNAAVWSSGTHRAGCQ